MKLYINEDVIAVNNKYENLIFLYDRFKHIKYDINEDMFNIIKRVYKDDGVSYEVMCGEYEGIENTISDLISLDIIKTKKQKRCNNIKELFDIPSARLFVELTDKCNLRCKHCYGDFKPENFNTLDIDALKELIDQAVNLGVYQFDITGGEPLLYPNLEELLSALYDAGMLVTVFSNLTVLTNKSLELLKKYKIKKIITSIDSSDAKAHDDFRGVKGSFNKTLDSINSIKTTSTIEVAVNTMVGKHNYNNIENTILFLKELNVPCVLDSIIPNGRAKEGRENPFYATQVIHDLYGKENINVVLKITDCGVGKRFMYVKSNGNICLCPSLTEKEFVFGNINKTLDIKVVWKKMLDKYCDLRCNKNCAKKEICNGGCRARALKFKKSLYAEDLNSCILSGECAYDEIK